MARSISEAHQPFPCTAAFRRVGFQRDRRLDGLLTALAMSFSHLRPQLAPLSGLGASFLGEMPTSVVRPYRGPHETLDMMTKHALGQYGERSIIVRRFTEYVVGQVQPKDYLGEILAIRNCLVQYSPMKPGTPLFRYLNDPVHLELIRTPERMVKDIIRDGSVSVDCDEVSCLAATMLLCCGRAARYVAMGFSPGNLSHVAVCGKEPKTQQWILLDGVAGPREKEAANSAKEILVRDLD